MGFLDTDILCSNMCGIICIAKLHAPINPDLVLPIDVVDVLKAQSHD